MEQILNKLSEIELTAQRIMEDCDRQKQQLSEEAEQKCKNYDRQLESRTAEQIRRIRQQLEEEKEKNKERIRKAYGESASGIGSKNIRKRRHIYIFNPEDLDNADIISMVESSPTYLRDKSTLSTIKTKAATEGQLATEEAQGGEDMGGVITF